MNHMFARAAVFRAAVLTSGSTYISYVLGLLVSVLVARALGPDDYGRYAYIVWLSGLLVMLANNGLTSTGIKFISECVGRQDLPSAAQVHHWLWKWQILCLALIGLLFVVVVPFVQPAGWSGQLGLLIGVVLLAAGTKALSMFNTSIAKGYGQFGIEALTNLIAALWYACITVVMTWWHAPAVVYMVMFASTGMMYLVWSYVLLQRAQLKPIARRPPAELLARVQPHLWWTVGLAAVYALGSRSVETLLLNAWVGAAEVGYFVIALSLTRGGVELLAVGLSTVLMPLMGYAFGSGEPQRIRRVFEDATRYYQFLGLIIAGVGWFWAEVVVNLMYGARYTAVIPVLKILVLSSGLLLANGAANAVLSNSDNQRFRVMVTTLSLALSAAIAVSLIPHYGVLGAALAQAGSSVICSVVLIAGIKKYIGLDAPWASLVRQYGAALLAACVGWGCLYGGGAKWGAWLAGPAYVAVLIAVSLLLGVWRADEVKQVQKILRRYPRVSGWLVK